MAEQEKSYVVQSVDDAINILMTVAEHPEAGVSEIARAAGVTKAKTFRLLRTLERGELVSQEPDGRWRLGNAILVLGTSASSQIDLVKLANPILEDLGLKTNETVQLRLRDKSEALCIAKYEPSRDLRVHAVVGRRRPLYAGSSKAIMAYLPEDERESVLPHELKAFTGNTITDRSRLFAELDRIRQTRICISRGEVSDQLVAVSAPVFSADGSVFASINIAAPAFRTDDTDIERFIRLVSEAAGRISEGLGWKGDASLGGRMAL
ncbi:IclR family transcriptional regulator [Afifella sp. YEN Y35]|uniref:IclR family transcriptional regulator n=1 Tax=Afifella sp. YEN Y35 TaxID=3388337 RepID=UPI0039DFD957